MAHELDVVERVLQLLSDGAYSSTYKMAVLVALIDLCVEETGASGWPPAMVTTRQVAEKVVRLYWDQVRDREGSGVLRQNSGQRGVILREVAKLRHRTDGSVSPGAGFGRARLASPAEAEELVRIVEWKLIEMPLPKLQRIGGVDTGWLYVIGWSDREPARRRDVVAYQKKLEGPFDNRIHLRPEVAMAFARLHELLRPFVQDRWAREVARINNMVDARLWTFLFGVERASLKPVRQPLRKLQQGRCFYCRGRLDARSHVDHFIPWARHPDNGLDNLVLVHERCNSSKSDHLPAGPHLAQWLVRRKDQAAALAAAAEEARWDPGANRTLGAARSLYLRLPPEARLWSAVDHFVPPDSAELQRLLA